MPGIKEAKGFFYSLLIIGTLVIIASLYSTVWASPSQGVNAEGMAQTLPTPDATATSVAATAAANAAATVAAVSATAQAEAVVAAAAAEATAAASDPVSVPVPPGGAIKAFAPGLATTLSAPDGKVTVTIPALAPVGSFFLLYEPEAQADAPAAAPAGLAFGTALFDLSVVDLAGVPVSGARFLSPITLSVTFTDEDVQAAQGNPSRLVLYKYDTIFEAWTPLTTSVNLADKTVEAKVSRLSFFALMGQAQPSTPTPTPTATLRPGVATPTDAPTATLLPPTPGDVAPGSGLLIGLLIAAFILIASGSYYLRQSKQT